MTTPSHAAVEAARECMIQMPFGDDAALHHLAAAFDRFASDILSNHWCEAHPRKPTLRHHQEDADHA